jgi:DNA invertase Pin-like site-specific DNA recombinase
VSAVRGREGPSFISESDQLARNRSYTETYGHTIIEEGSDLDVSGGVMSRPTFDRFLDLVKRREADGIIVAKLDRFARSNVGALEAVEEIENAGGTLVSVAEQLDASTSAGRFLRDILFAAAAWERERIGEGWHAAQAAAVNRGIHVAPYVPPGFKRGPKAKRDGESDRRLVPHQRHAETIRRAFTMASEGADNSAIADYLNERSLPVTRANSDATAHATHWVPSRIPRLLANRVYRGEARYGGLVNREAHEPLVDERTWLLAQRGSSTPTTLRKPNRDTEPSMLSGIVRCAACRFAMKPQAAGKTSPAIYRCTTETAHGRCSDPSTIAKERVEQFVLDEFVAAADDPHFFGSRTTSDRARTNLDAEATAAETSYRAALTNVALRAKIGDDDHDAMVAAQYDAWQAKFQAARDARRDAGTIPLRLPEGVSLRELVERLRSESKTEELRGLLSEGIEAVFVRRASSRAHNLPVRDRVRIVWRGDEDVSLPQRGRRFEPLPYVWED